MKKIMYGAFGLVIIGIIGVIISINTSGVEAFTFSSVDVHETKEVKADKISKIMIDSSTVDVNVEPTSGDMIEADFSGSVGKKSKDLYTLDIDNDGDTVKITMEKKNKFQFMMLNFTKVRLNVKLPEKVYKSIEINAESADIVFDDTKAKQVAIETESGDIEVSGVVAENNLMLNASSGDIVTNDLRANQLKMKTISGDITVKDNKAKVLEILSSSGDITLNNQVLEDTKMETSSGDMIVKVEEMKGSVSLESSSGDIDARITKAHSSMKVDFKGSSGDGKAEIDGMNFAKKSEHRIIGQIGDGKFKLMARTDSGDFNIKD